MLSLVYATDSHSCYCYCYCYYYYCYCCSNSTAEDTRLAELILYTTVLNGRAERPRAALLALQQLSPAVRTELIAGCDAFADTSTTPAIDQIVGKLDFTCSDATTNSGTAPSKKYATRVNEYEKGSVNSYMCEPWCADLQQYLQQPAEERLHCSLLVCAAALYNGNEARELLQLLLLPALKTDTKFANSLVKQQRSYLQQALCVAINTAYTAGAEPSLVLLKALRDQRGGLSRKYTMTAEDGDATTTLLTHLHVASIMALYSEPEELCSDLDVIVCARNLAQHTLQ
jgi:hypothetical protein